MRYRLRTIMVAIALLAPAFAVIAPRLRTPGERRTIRSCWGRPILDPIPGEFDPPSSDLPPGEPMCRPPGEPSGEDFQ